MMDAQHGLSRRGFLSRICMATAVIPLIGGCGADGEPAAGRTTAAAVPPGEAAASCTDTSGLSDQQKQVRRALKYVDRSPHADKRCKGCRFFSAPRSGQTCGGCSAVPGPIHPQGYCTAWAAAS